MTTPINEDELKRKYASFTNAQIKQELEQIRSIPDARTDINALTRLSILLPEMEKRGLYKSRSAAAQENSGPSVGTAVLGIVLIIGGIALSAGTGRIFYGAVLVGIFMLVKAFI